MFSRGCSTPAWERCSGFPAVFRGRRRLITDDLLPPDRPTSLVIIIFAGALIGLIWGKKIWATIERSCGDGWGSKRDVQLDDADRGERR